MQFSNVIKERNHLEVNKVDYRKNRNNKQLIILVEINRIKDDKEVYVLLKGHNLIIEAPVNISLEKPVRIHLLEREILEEFKTGATEIGFTEIRLNRNYNYDLVLYRMIQPGLLKIVLNYKTNGRVKTHN